MQILTSYYKNVQIASVINVRSFQVKQFTSRKGHAEKKAQIWLNRFNRIAIQAAEYQN